MNVAGILVLGCMGILGISVAYVCISWIINELGGKDE